MPNITPDAHKIFNALASLHKTQSSILLTAEADILKTTIYQDQVYYIGTK